MRRWQVRAARASDHMLRLSQRRRYATTYDPRWSVWAGWLWLFATTDGNTTGSTLPESSGGVSVWPLIILLRQYAAVFAVLQAAGTSFQRRHSVFRPLTTVPDRRRRVPSPPMACLYFSAALGLTLSGGPHHRSSPSAAPICSRELHAHRLFRPTPEALSFSRAHDRGRRLTPYTPDVPARSIWPPIPSMLIACANLCAHLHSKA